LIIIEGGGTSGAEQVPLRKGFKALFDKLREGKLKPRIVCAGGRGEAFKDFKTVTKADSAAICWLLVDSEGPVASSPSPWDHVACRRGDGWQRPEGATDEQLHFMVETMETWLVADPDALATYYGSELKKTKLPGRKNLEEVPKADVMAALLAATEHARTKGKYQKSHGFDLIGSVDPKKVRIACPGLAERFFAALESA